MCSAAVFVHRIYKFLINILQEHLNMNVKMTRSYFLLTRHVWCYFNDLVLHLGGMSTTISLHPFIIYLFTVSRFHAMPCIHSSLAVPSFRSGTPALQLTMSPIVFLQLPQQLCRGGWHFGQEQLSTLCHFRSD